MAAHGTRRSRVIESDDEDSREGTPFSTTSNDGKRARRSLDDDSIPSSPSTTSSVLPVRSARKNPVAADISGRNGHVRKKPGHQPGAIVRVKLTNFVTYTSAEFFPGPNLNMVIGPNGTGKSTLVCAICLGLGWGTQYLGRAKDLAEFVKHGCREATIEIELQRATEGKAATPSNPIITRTIRREGNKSTFTLDGTQQPAKAIMKLAQSFEIQIDNLCQFLPQDKVVEFAQMTPIQILESTQRAAALPEMLTMHEDLKALRTQQTEHMNNNKGDEEQLKNLVNRQEMQRTEVERLRERVIVQKRLNWLERCRPIPRYCEAKRLKNTAKEQMKALERELKALERESAPTLQKVNSKQEYLRRVKDAREQRKDVVKDAQQECGRLSKEIDRHTTVMTDLDNRYRAEERSRPGHKNEIAKARITLTTLRNQQATPPEPFDSRAMNQKIQGLSDQRRAIIDEQEDIAAQAIPMVEQRKTREIRLQKLEAEREKLKTSEGRLENQLKNLSQDTFRAWEWINANRDRFQQTVYGPPLIECSIKDQSRAVLAEACLQFNDFKVITTQCREDFKLLQRELISNQRLHDISLRQCALSSLDGLRRPMEEQQMREYGIDGWVIDLVDGPPTVLAMLCQERFLHQTATAARDISEQQYDQLVNTTVKGYVCKTGGYQFIRRAEYGAAGNSARDINMKPKNFWTGQGGDGGRLAHVETEIRNLKGEMNELSAHLRPLATKQKDNVARLEVLDPEIEGLRTEKEEKQKLLTEYKSLGTKIGQVEARIVSYQTLLDELADRLATINNEKEQAMFAKADMVLQYVDAIHTLRGKTQELLEIEVAAIEAQSDVETLTARNRHIVNTIAEKRTGLKDAKVTVHLQNEKAIKLVEEVKKLRDEGLQLEERDGDDSLTATLEEVSSSNEVTEKDLDNLIEVENAKLELTEGGDSGAIKEYEERAKKIGTLQDRVTEYATKQADYIHAIKEVREAWEPELDRLVAKISDTFGESFARIGCAGQVVVYKASSGEAGDCTEELGGTENGLDFANWAIHIRVKFREHEPLTLLDSHRQSGGERAVSTIFYLMALQSLSRAPFRVVDEINQGMDPRNERMVHGRMVDIAAADENGEGQGSQYFLITPKLLSGLKYKPGMTVLCIVSGENMPAGVDQKRRDENGQVYVEPGRKIDFAAFARTARKFGMGRSGARGMSFEANLGTRKDRQRVELGVVGA